VNVDVRVETVIHAPLADVAAYASAPSHAPEWYANISSVEWKTPPPAQVGSRVAFVAHFLGRRIAYTGSPSGFGSLTAPLVAAAERGDELDRVLHGRRTSA
jgi:hypothetical protein